MMKRVPICDAGSSFLVRGTGTRRRGGGGGVNPARVSGGQGKAGEEKGQILAFEVEKPTQKCNVKTAPLHKSVS